MENIQFYFFSSTKIDFWPFLKLQKMDFGHFKTQQSKMTKKGKPIGSFLNHFFRILAHCAFYISYILWYNDEVITHLPIHGEDAAMSIINKNVGLTFVQGWRKKIQKSEKLYLFICTTQLYIYRGPLPYFEYS